MPIYTDGQLSLCLKWKRIAALNPSTDSPIIIISTNSWVGLLPPQYNWQEILTFKPNLFLSQSQSRGQSQRFDQSVEVAGVGTISNGVHHCVRAPPDASPKTLTRSSKSGHSRRSLHLPHYTNDKPQERGASGIRRGHLDKRHPLVGRVGLDAGLDGVGRVRDQPVGRARD